MKRLFLILMAVLLLAALAACGNNAQTEVKETQAVTESPKGPAETQNTAEPATAPEDDSAASKQPPQTVPGDPAPAADDAAAHSDVLVVYFSATGTTKGVAEKIAALTGADLYEIKAVQEYTADDLNWHDSGSRTTLEQNDKSVRPEIGSEPLSLEGYTTVYIGYPIWWGEEPRILDTFVESCDFSGLTLIPFCTSGGSGVGRSGKNLAELAGSGTWLDGRRFGGNVSENDLQTWIDSLN